MVLTIIVQGEIYHGFDLRYYVVHNDLFEEDKAFWTFEDAVGYVLEATWRI